MKRLFTAIASLLIAVVCMQAQINTPSPSPTAEFEQRVGLTDITIVYSRPGVKDRTIFATDGLVPYGKMWRTGANASTTIEFSEDVVLAGQDVKAGKYSIYTIPNATSWEIMLNTDVTLGGNTEDYDTEKEVARITADVNTMPFSVETFTITIGSIRNSSAELGFIWDNVYVGVPIELHTDDQVMEQINNFADNPMGAVASNYLNAGWYLHTEGKEAAKAVTFMKKGVEYSDGPFKFFWMNRASQVIAANGDYKGALSMAKKALEAGASAPANFQGFFNDTVKPELDANIAKWSAM